uniref:Uncharacterized protein n=1 Tax=Anguilla anguilla TaxID=7936 RepID=A0A0E9WDM2_ANGAN
MFISRYTPLAHWFTKAFVSHLKVYDSMIS